MIKLSNIFEKFLIYKNYKVFLLTFYSILGLLIYLNWDFLYESWIDGLKTINMKFEEPKSIFIIIYYCFFSFYAILFLFWPLLIFDKKYDSNHKVSIKLPTLNKENSFKAIRDILLFIAFPILSILGILIWIILDIAFYTLGYILGILFFAIIIILIAYLTVSNLSKIVKNIF